MNARPLLQHKFVLLLSSLLMLFQTKAFGLGFTSPTYYATSGAYTDVEGDFNNDGKLDIAVVSTAGVSILLGNGNGTFQTARNFATGAGPIAIAIGDFNDDGRLDIVTLNQGDASNGVAPSLSILLGNGDGTFQAAHNQVLSFTPSAVAVADLNADSRSDVVVVGNGTAVFLSNGDGTVRSAASFSVGGHSVVLADFNRDGKLDIAVASGSSVANPSTGRFTGHVAILLGDGGGSFHAGAVYYTGTVGNIAVGDFNGDGKPDLAVTYRLSIYSKYGLAVWPGVGDGTFTGTSSTSLVQTSAAATIRPAGCISAARVLGSIPLLCCAKPSPWGED